MRELLYCSTFQTPYRDTQAEVLIDVAFELVRLDNEGIASVVALHLGYADDTGLWYAVVTFEVV